MGMILTSQYQNWKVVALLSGLGFTLSRTSDEDVFTTPSIVARVFDGWELSKDGSRLSNWEELSDPESPHFGRRYLTVHSFKSPDGHDDVIVWVSSPHSGSDLFFPIALGSFQDWNKLKDDSQVEQWLWLERNKISL